MSLSTEQHMSGGSFLDVDVIIFEEFMERGSYLPGTPSEPDKLMIFYSTIDRKRGTTKLYMVRKFNNKSMSVYKRMGSRENIQKYKTG